MPLEASRGVAASYYINYYLFYMGMGVGWGYTWGCSQLWEVGGKGERGNTPLFGHRGAMFEMRLGRPNLGIGPGAFFFP